MTRVPQKDSSKRSAARPNHGGFLQRKCTCGGSSGLTGSCSDCEKKKLLGQPLQTKLRINEPGDEYEQEADRVAEQVMRMAEPARETNRPKTATATLVRRKVNANSAGVATPPPLVHDVLASPGQPLDAATRTFFEPRFGHDFSQVRVHSDGHAADSAQAVAAHAYTVGEHMGFATGRFNPGTREGRRLLAHELSHVVQGFGTSGRTQVLQRKADISAHAEEEAKPMPPVDCTVEITPTHNCFDLIAEMIAIQADTRENNQWLERYRNGDIPWDGDAYKTRAMYHGELRAKFQAKERVRAACCPDNQVPGEAPTAAPSPAPAPQRAPPGPSSGDQ
jgi:hypothetical protein